mgnify:CR=1 FL=1
MDKKIKVCHLTSAHESNDIRIFQKECTTLAKEENLEVYLVAQGESRVENGVRVVGIGKNSGGRLNRMLKVARQIYKQAASLKADIYHFHDPELLLFARKLKRQGSVVIFDSHEHYSQQISEKQYLPSILRNIIASIYKVYETYVVKRIDAVIIPGTIERKNPFSGRSKNSILLGNYPILDERRGYAKRIKPSSIEDVKVCYVGGLCEQRGITKLVKGCYKAGVKLILAGSFSPSEYKQKIFSMEESKCIDYRGICNYDEVTTIYQESHIGAATPLKIGQFAKMENLLTKVYEYMQVGIPIIMSDTAYNKKLMESEDFAYLVNPDDEDKLADTIISIYHDYDKAIKKTELARKLIEEKYNWNISVRNLITLYRKLYYNSQE